MAVHTKLNTDNFKIILSQYNIGDLVNFTPISEGIENTNYFIETTQDKFVLTIFEKRVNKKDLPFYLNLMCFLAENSIPCPKISPNKNNSLTFQHNGKIGTIISFLKGKMTLDINEKQCASLGNMLAKLHLSGQKFVQKKTNDFSINSINQFQQQLKLKKIINSEPSQICTTELQRISAIDHSALSQGIIHGDLFPDNVFFDPENNITGIIDFYFSCYDYLIYDLAVCINAWCFDGNIKYNHNKAVTLIKNYYRINNMSSAEFNLLNDYCILTAIRFYFTRLYDEFFHNKESIVEKKDPNEYLEKIKFFTKNRVFNYRDYQ